MSAGSTRARASGRASRGGPGRNQDQAAIREPAKIPPRISERPTSPRGCAGAVLDRVAPGLSGSVIVLALGTRWRRCQSWQQRACVQVAYDIVPKPPLIGRLTTGLVS